MIGLLLLVVLLGVALYLVETYVPMAPPLKTVFRALVVIFVLVYVWAVFFGRADVPVPRI
jgi:hypothetical protein